jgi:hypothetical protein
VRTPFKRFFFFFFVRQKVPIPCLHTEARHSSDHVQQRLFPEPRNVGMINNPILGTASGQFAGEIESLGLELSNATASIYWIFILLFCLITRRSSVQICPPQPFRGGTEDRNPGFRPSVRATPAGYHGAADRSKKRVLRFLSFMWLQYRIVTNSIVALVRTAALGAQHSTPTTPSIASGHLLFAQR